MFSQWCYRYRQCFIDDFLEVCLYVQFEGVWVVDVVQWCVLYEVCVDFVGEVVYVFGDLCVFVQLVVEESFVDCVGWYVLGVGVVGVY